jgi:hypothetical protein
LLAQPTILFNHKHTGRFQGGRARRAFRERRECTHST